MAHCQHCFEAVRQILPRIEPREQLDLLVGATAYPAAGCERVKDQLRELATATDGTLDGCLAYADGQTEMWIEAALAMDALFGEDRQAVPA